MHTLLQMPTEQKLANISNIPLRAHKYIKYTFAMIC